MIGDNPQVDIKGANASGFESVLVRQDIFHKIILNRTGVFHSGANDPEYPAKHVVDDVFHAVQKILSIEGI